MKNIKSIETLAINISISLNRFWTWVKRHGFITIKTLLYTQTFKLHTAIFFSDMSTSGTKV